MTKEQIQRARDFYAETFGEELRGGVIDWIESREIRTLRDLAEHEADNAEADDGLSTGEWHAVEYGFSTR